MFAFAIFAKIDEFTNKGAPNGLPADHIQTYSEDEEDYDQNNFRFG